MSFLLKPIPMKVPKYWVFLVFLPTSFVWWWAVHNHLHTVHAIASSNGAEMAMRVGGHGAA